MKLNAAQKLLESIGAPFELGGKRKYGKRQASKAEVAAKGRTRQHQLNRAANLKRNAARSAKNNEQINLGRVEREKARQLRAHYLGRDFSPMPGHPSLIGAAA